MLLIDLDVETERRLAELVEQTGWTSTDFVRELIEEAIEDLEDIALAEARLSEGGTRISLAEVRRDLGLDS
jgi:predicted DNA-binding protein